jgi:hypothetical protein
MAITYSLVDTDWTVDNITGNIRYAGNDHNGTSPSYATVIQLHRWLGQLADDQAPNDTSDKMYIPIPKASDRSTDNIITLVNGFNIDAIAAQHLYDGTISQNSGDDVWDGIVNFGNANVQIQIIQNGIKVVDDFWNYNYGGAATGGSGTTLIDTGSPFAGDLANLVGYTVMNSTDDARGIVSVATDADTVTFPAGELYGSGTLDFAAVDDYLIGYPLNPDSGQGISHRFLIKVRENGADIDGRRLIGICRRPGNTFSWFPINGTSRGNNVLALSDSSDLNYDTANQTVMGGSWDGEFSGEDQGFQQQDVDANLTDEDYFGELTWSGDHDVNDLYMRAMGETCDFGDYTVHGLDGEVMRGVTHSFLYDNEAGTPSISDYDMMSFGMLVTHDTPTGAFVVGEVIVDQDPTGAVAPSFWATIVSIDVGTSMVVRVDSGSLGNTTQFWGVTSGADADTTLDPDEAETGGGLLHVLAHDVPNDTMYVQILTGTIPADGRTLYYCSTDEAAADHTDMVDLNGTATDYTIPKTTPYIGVSTGTALLGAHGIGVLKTKLQATDSVLPLGESTPISPPLTITNTYSGLDTTNDQILVTPTDGITIDINGDPPVGCAMFTILTALSGAGEVSVVVQEDLDEGTSKIDNFLPTSGYISIVNDEGTVVDHVYSGYVGATDTFTITSYDFSGSGANDSVSVGNYAFVYQMHIETAALDGGTVTQAEVNAIVGSTPDSGTIRIINDDGFHIRHPYSSYVDATDIFTITSAVFNGGSGLTQQAGIGSGAYVSYIDKAAASASEVFAAVYDNDLNLCVVVRDGDGSPIKEDKKRHTFTNSNASHGVTRTSDT